MDIDLVYLPVNGRTEALADICQNLDKLEKRLCAAMPGVQMQRPQAQDSDSQRLTLRRDNVQIKVDSNQELETVVEAIK